MLAPAFRPLGRSGPAALQRWLAEPHVARWWNADPSPTAVEGKYGPRMDGIDSATVMWIAEVNGEACGRFQHHLDAGHPDADEAVGIDEPPTFAYARGRTNAPPID